MFANSPSNKLKEMKFPRRTKGKNLLESQKDVVT